MQRIHFYLLASAILIVSACSKDIPTPAFTPGYSIYFAGKSGSYAVYWKNGKQINLSNNADANAMVLSDTNVYIAGAIYSGADEMATYWKNGKQIQLEKGGISHASGIAVDGSDVYCSGDHFGPLYSGRDTAVYWKNGKRTALSPFTNGVARSIYVYGSTVYIAGRTWGTFDSAVVWENGVESWYATPGSMNAIGITGNNIYFVGGSNDASYWSRTAVKTLSYHAFAGSIAISGSDVYIAGGTSDSLGNTHACYWKNDLLIPLSNKYKESAVSAIAVAGADVYAGGYIFEDGKTVPVYWKNGVLNKLAGEGEVNAVCIKKENP
jgi:hypothetical protein